MTCTVLAGLGRLFVCCLCWMTIGRRSLDQFRQDEKRNGWEACNKHLRDTVTQITTIQGLVLAVSAAFLTTPLQAAVDSTTPICYIWFFWAFAISSWGLFCQLLFFRVNLLLTMEGGACASTASPPQHAPTAQRPDLERGEVWATEVGLPKEVSMAKKLSTFACLMYLVLYALTHNTFIFSLICLGGGVLEALGGGGWLFWFCAVSIACLMLLVALCIRDTPEANVNLITICTIILTVVFVMVGFGYTFTVEEDTGLLGSNISPQNTTNSISPL